MHPALDKITQQITYTLPPGVPARYLSGAKYIFTAYGCALLERQTAKGFVYYVVNLSDGRTEALGRTTKQLGKTSHAGLAEKTRVSSVRGRGLYEADRQPGERLKRNELAALLQHILSDILPEYGFVYRENQLELSEHMLDTISHRGVSLAESAVGTGKTLAYLVAAVLAKRGRINDFWLRGNLPGQSYADSVNLPVVIATSSIALQRAIATDYIPELSRILLEHDIIRVPLTCAIRKGKEHYLCEKRLRAYYNDADARTQATLAPLLCDRSPCDLADLDGLTPYVKKQICVSGGCKEGCRYYKSCRYLRYLSEAEHPKVDFLITNHNYFLADVLHKTTRKRPLLPVYQLVVIDEAHKFLTAARQMYGLELSDREIPVLADTIHSFTEDVSADGVNIHRLAKKMEEKSCRLFDLLRQNAVYAEDNKESGCFSTLMDKGTARLMKNIAGLADDLAAALENSPVALRFKERKVQAIRSLENIENIALDFTDYEDLVCWLERPEDTGEGETIIHAIPKQLAAMLHADLWSMGIPFILTSGTLSASDGDFTRTKQALGIDRLPKNLVRDISLSSPFDFKRNTLLYLSNVMPFPNQKEKEYIIAVADETERLIRTSHGHAAVLFTSYSVMGQVFAALKGRNLPYQLFQMGRRDMAALEKFKTSGNGVLFASGALWEGIDIPGDALSMLIIVKLPFAVPDPIGEYERSLFGSMKAYRNCALIPDMQVRLKQGNGRLLRTETDTGVCAILDCRANPGEAYYQYILAALPPCRVTTNICDIEPFFRETKPPSYFTEVPACKTA